MEKTMPIQLTLWQEDSPVSRSLSQETEGGQTMTAISGLRCYELSKKPNQDGLLEKMFLASSTWHSTMCKLTWRENTTKSGNSYYRLLPSMLTTEETESSSLPTETQLWSTPAASTGGGIPLDAAERGWKWEGTYWRRPDGTKYQTQLIDQARMWPTPTVKGNYNKKGLSAKSGDGLATAVNKARMWPTATARDWRSGKASEKSMRRNSRPLNEVVVREERMWPTPMAHEARLGYQDRSRGKKGTQESLTTKVINNLGGRQEVSGQLNPEWVEWLMGFPIGWTESRG
tara:strand:+ start:302 stop:1162 length:861 start_codon:yes stop_codon:yes gene_type:complete